MEGIDREKIPNTQRRKKVEEREWNERSGKVEEREWNERSGKKKRARRMGEERSRKKKMDLERGKKERKERKERKEKRRDKLFFFFVCFGFGLACLFAFFR